MPNFARGCDKMFYEIINMPDGRGAIRVGGLGKYSLKNTLECGQCFRYELICENDGYVEYMTVIAEKIIRVAQKTAGELFFIGMAEDDFLSLAVPYFTLETDYEEIKNDILKKCDSPWLKAAADAACGIAILKQDPWETLFSFIISQNNNIPRIRSMIRKLSAEYGVNICLRENIKTCPLGKINTTPCENACSECGICYTFPTAKDVYESPEKMKLSNPGFRYKYLYDAAMRVATGKINLDMIGAARSYEHTKSCLTKILGVGEKVASCTALFGFGNLEAFPIDVWMKRAIDEYFGGVLDPKALGRYAGVAQQYIFHYIRNLRKQEN